ncbi:MAG TPA: aminotransferase class V-fold PLP-dependent enzyme [Candidatus Acidoferrales bacterium]|nr:aminotransferase class V-fold PLP-dependent enzyme [Candidatus Acidoferrales bacterium]
MDWRTEWFEFEDVSYLNLAGQCPLPRASIRAVQAAIEWKKFPHQMPDSAYFDIPNRIRASLAKLIGARPEEIALTTGATGGLTAVAHGFDWKPEDEILIAAGEFPAHFTTWKPVEAQGHLKVKVVHPRERFITADDFIAAMGPRTRLVSASLVRFDDGSRLDAGRVAQACHERSALLLLDASQCAGAMKMDVAKLGADFIVSAGYKWLLGPYGTGFFWARSEHIERMRVQPFYWMALEGADNFSSLSFEEARPARGARRWDSPETASFFNLSAMDASLEFVLRAGVETIEAHNRRLMELMLERLPKDRCVAASPADPAERGPYACFAARSPEKTAALYDKLRKAGVITSLREGKVRVSPHLYNTERDIDRLISVVTA